MTDNSTSPQEKSGVHPTFIVGVGSSAGGLDALQRFFDGMPTDSGMAFVLVQHLSPDFKSMMNELLARHTEMKIVSVEDAISVEANSVYLIPPKKNMILSKGRLLLTDQDSSGGLNLPIDIFFRSLALDAGKRSVAIVLSGTGSDGSRGLRDIHEAGGLVIAQEAESAAFDGMPRAAIGSGLADVICRPEAMPEWLVRYSRDTDAFPRGADNDDVVFANNAETTAIFRMFRQHYGIDFSFYKATTITRRLERRVQLTDSVDLADYLKRLESDPTELDILYRDLLVEVTQFFRDPEAFNVLKDRVISPLVEQAASRGEIRAWIAGCATGEEAYSIAMLLDDAAETAGSEVDIKVFATDVHQSSMETASAGVYSTQAVTKVPEKFRQKYFTRTGDVYHVSATLRKMVIFAPHDITRDPPFTRIDILSCRNVLIYLDPVVQAKVLSLFHFGLKVGGTLLLGPSETVGDLNSEFDELDRSWNLYRKIRNVRLPHSEPIGLSAPLRKTVQYRPSFVATTSRAEKGWLIPEAYHELLNKYAPPSLLVNQHNELVHTFGEARKLLSQPTGRATLDVTRMLEGDLATAVVAALHKCASNKEPVNYRGVRVTTENGEKRFTVSVEPFSKSSEKMYLVSLEEEEVRAVPETDGVSESFDSEGEAAERITMLERELSYTRETLQATVEELETSNEELQSTNEELVASNEELQSTNEELHSVNEELHTVNTEHQRKIEELMSLTTDMDNLLISTEIGTIFLDRDFQIRRYTPAARDVFHILPQDEGRPIEHIAHTLKDLDLKGLLVRSLDEAEPVEQRTQDENEVGRLVRCTPYREGNSIAGVVLTIVKLPAAE